MTHSAQMRNIAAKVETLRTAIAVSYVKMRPSTIQLILDGRTPKGDPRPFAQVAAITAAKKTSDLIPFCHPLLVDHVHVDFELTDDTVISTITVTAVAKTGVEMEALTAASLAALTFYDMLKPVDDDLEITGCRLVKKLGGKSDLPKAAPTGLRTAVLVASDSTVAGRRVDRSGNLVCQQLQDWGITEPRYVVLPDDRKTISAALIELSGEGFDLVITTGGTGFGPRDVTTEATLDVIDRQAGGISEAIRAYGQKRTPYAFLSRGVAGIRGTTLIVNLPGSPGAVEDGIKAIFPAIFHAFPIMEGAGHGDHV